MSTLAIVLSILATTQISESRGEKSMLGRQSFGTIIQSPSDSIPLLHLPFVSTGGLIPDDANTVCHVWFDGTQIQDTKGCAWTMNGVVPQNVASPFYPSGFSGSNQKAAGAFSDANYYSTAIGTFNFASDFWACFVYVPISTSRVLFDSMANGGFAGFWVDSNLGGTLRFGLGTGTSVLALATSSGVAFNGPNVGCVGLSGTTMMAKLNLGTTVTQINATPTLTSPAAPRLGRYQSAATAFDGTLIEAIFVSGTPTDTIWSTLIRRVFGMLGSLGQTITVTRSSIGTYTTPAGLIWTAPANVARVGCEDSAATKCGVLIEPTRTNLVLQSEALDNVAWTATNVTVTANQCVLPIGPSGTTTLESLASTVNTGTVAQAVTVTSSTGPHTVSGYFRATAGTQTGSIGMTFGTGNATSCTCVRSDGGTCTTGTSTATGFAYGSFTTASAVRMMLTCSTTLAAVSVTPFATGGQYLTSTGTVCGGAMQFEQAVSPYASSYIATVGTSVARTIETVSATNPLAAINPSSWCTEAVATPENGRAWSPHVTMFPFIVGYGVNGTANSVEYFRGTDFVVVDAASGTKSITVASGFTPGSTHKSSFGASNGSLKLLHDDVSVGSQAGAGTGLITTWPTNVHVGSDSAGSFGFGGWIRDVKVYKRACR